MIVIGVDVHKHTLTAVAVDEVGRPLAERTCAVDDGVIPWAQVLGGERLWALEDCRHVTRRLEHALVAAGETLVRVPPRLTGPHRRRNRTRGKSDGIDAAAVARAALQEPQLDGPRPGEETLRELKLLVDHRDDLVAERRRAQQRLRWHLHDLDPSLQVPAGALDRAVWLDRVGRKLARLEQTTQVRIARDLLGRCRASPARSASSTANWRRGRRRWRQVVAAARLRTVERRQAALRDGPHRAEQLGGAQRSAPGSCNNLGASVCVLALRSRSSSPCARVMAAAPTSRSRAEAHLGRVPQAGELAPTRSSRRPPIVRHFWHLQGRVWCQRNPAVLGAALRRGRRRGQRAASVPAASPRRFGAPPAVAPGALARATASRVDPVRLAARRCVADAALSTSAAPVPAARPPRRAPARDRRSHDDSPPAPTASPLASACAHGTTPSSTAQVLRQRPADLVDRDSGKRVLVHVHPDHDHSSRLLSVGGSGERTDLNRGSCQAPIRSRSTVSGRRQRHNTGKSALRRRSGIESAAANPSLCPESRRHHAERWQ